MGHLPGTLQNNTSPPRNRNLQMDWSQTTHVGHTGRFPVEDN